MWTKDKQRAKRERNSRATGKFVKIDGKFVVCVWVFWVYQSKSVTDSIYENVLNRRKTPLLLFAFLQTIADSNLDWRDFCDVHWCWNLERRHRFRRRRIDSGQKWFVNSHDASRITMSFLTFRKANIGVVSLRVANCLLLWKPSSAKFIGTQFCHFHTIVGATVMHFNSDLSI